MNEKKRDFLLIRRTHYRDMIVIEWVLNGTLLYYTAVPYN